MLPWMLPILIEGLNGSRTRRLCSIREPSTGGQTTEYPARRRTRARSTRAVHRACRIPISSVHAFADRAEIPSRKSAAKSDMTISSQVTCKGPPVGSNYGISVNALFRPDKDLDQTVAGTAELKRTGSFRPFLFVCN